MPTVATRFRAIAISGALTLGATACAAESDDRSRVGGSTGTTVEGTGDSSAGASAADGGPSNASGEDGASPASNGPGSTPSTSSTPSEEGGADALPDGGAASAADGGSGTSPPDAGGPSGGACAGGTVGTPSTSGSGSNTYGDVELTVSTKTHITSFTTTLTVPAKPTSQSGTLFLWPGLEPLTESVSGDVGVLQPVLTWGGTCAPGAPNNYDSWWISGQFVTAAGSCAGGAGMDVAVGDQLNLAFTLSGTTWTQTITDLQTGKTVTFQKDLKGLPQDWTLFEIESDGVEPISDVIFTSTTLTFADPDPSACQPSSFGIDDYYSAPVTSTDGKACCISKIILRAKGVPPTSPNSP